jgi:hypothetical protein
MEQWNSGKLKSERQEDQTKHLSEYWKTALFNNPGMKDLINKKAA